MERFESQPVHETFELFKRLCPEIETQTLLIAAEVYMLMKHPNNPNEYVMVSRSSEEKALINPLTPADMKILAEKLSAEAPTAPEHRAPPIYGRNQWWKSHGRTRTTF